jgi:branched-chain amino acid transport system permease protein
VLSDGERLEDLDDQPGSDEPARRISPLDDERVRRVLWTVAGVGAFWLAIQLIWPVPIGTIIEGAVLGGLTALIALGIALSYKANRIVNFAAADLGAPGAVLGVLLITAWGVPFLVAVPTGIVAGLLLGLLVETLVIRRFFKAPRLILTVVTIGVSGIAGAGALFIPRLFDVNIPPQDYPSPLDWSFSIGTTIFRGNHIIAMITIPLVIAGLVFFFRYTSVGIAVRASASSADRAFLLGVPVKRMQTVVWMLVAGFATLAMLLRAGIIGLPIGRLLGPEILLPALAAAVIGRMERFPTIVVAAFATGIVHLAVFRSTREAQFVAPVLFAVLIVALGVQRRFGTRLAAAATSTWKTIYEPRPVPRELRGLPEVVWGKRLLGFVLMALLVSAPLFLSGGDTIRLAGMMIFAMLGISLVILTGWAGEVSLGQVAFLGIGAAVAGGLTQHLEWDLALALLAAGLAGAATAVLIGLPALRVRGMFLAVTTLALALATSDYFLNQRFFGDYLPGGLVERPPFLLRVSVTTDQRMYYLILASLILSILAAKEIRRTRTGRALLGLRENERAAQAFGINAMRVKLSAFALSGFIAAFAGGLFVHLVRSLGVSPFMPGESLKAFIMVMLGGAGVVSGAIIGAFVLGFGEAFGYAYLPGGTTYLVIFIALILFLVIRPQRIMGKPWG